MGRKAEGKIHVIKPLMGRFGSKPFLDSQHIAWSRDTAQKTSEYCVLTKMCKPLSIMSPKLTRKWS